ncbi:hypothetical protein Bca52824_046767 [Brassica carinata]|uniref:Uncharacterized protein n=1 Tax=Brassica carinata TaxID=52824 RepID=A0A8X7RHU1_BRACI|nr:hypothetical protein Bca52824_046767 [Brassica carinata]
MFLTKMFLGAALGGSLDSSPLQRSSGSSGSQLDVGALARYESEFPLAKSAFGDIQKASLIQPWRWVSGVLKQICLSSLVYRISILCLSFTAVFALEDLSTSEACCKPGFRLFPAILGIVLSRVHRFCFFGTVGIVPPVPLFNSKTNFTSVLEGSGWRGVRKLSVVLGPFLPWWLSRQVAHPSAVTSFMVVLLGFVLQVIPFPSLASPF